VAQIDSFALEQTGSYIGAALGFKRIA
jgi:hypothetical protein